MKKIDVWHPPGLKNVIEEAYGSPDAWKPLLENLIQDISIRGRLYFCTRSTFIDDKWRTIQTETLAKSELKPGPDARGRDMCMTEMEVDDHTYLNLLLMCRIKQLVVRQEEKREGPFTFEYMLYLQMHNMMHEKALEILRRKAKEEREQD